MKSKASAPGKIILFGEHFVVYGIKAILCSIDRRVYVTSEKISEKEIRIKSNIGELIIPISTPIKEIDSPLKPFYYLADKIIKKYNHKSGIEVLVDSQIPIGAGLGSSSACCVAGAASLSRLFEQISNEEILELSIEAEKTIFQNTSGADCTVCTFGGIMKYDKENGFSRIDSQPTFNLVIANSNIVHSTEEVVSKVKQFKESNEEIFSKLCNEEEKLTEQVLLGLKKNDIVSLGGNMLKNQQFLEQIGVSNEKLRDMIELTKGISFGAKITGAGGGGCIFALTDHSNLEKTMEQFRKNNYECFSVKIDFKGLDTF